MKNLSDSRHDVTQKQFKLTIRVSTHQINYTSSSLLIISTFINS